MNNRFFSNVVNTITKISALFIEILIELHKVIIDLNFFALIFRIKL
jgi:hypothetical protein